MELSTRQQLALAAGIVVAAATVISLVGRSGLTAAMHKLKCICWPSRSSSTTWTSRSHIRT